MTDKVDFKRQLDSYRAKRHVFRVVEVPPLQYLIVDGKGDPNTGQEFAEATAALYPRRLQAQVRQPTRPRQGLRRGHS